VSLLPPPAAISAPHRPLSGGEKLQRQVAASASGRNSVVSCSLVGDVMLVSS
jgi:hypothetical protein